MKRIIFIHLQNDFSGSPRVLRDVITAVDSQVYSAEVFYGGNREGFLSDLPVKKIQYPFKRFENKKILTLISYIISQIILALMLFRYRNIECVFYVNTMMPFGAGIAGKILNKKVIYHIHETSISPNILKKFLRYVIKISASKIVFVSKFVQKVEHIPSCDDVVIYNVAEAKSSNIQRTPVIRSKDDKFRVLMICSLKDYKGLPELVKLANNNIICKKIKFRLIVSASQDEISAYFSKFETLPENLEILPVQRDVTSHYIQSDLLINLSRPDQWIETFGLTILEAMTFGLPCIVPPVGGPTELVIEDYNGFLIDPYDQNTLVKKLNYIACNDEKYRYLSRNSYLNSEKFNFVEFEKDISAVIREVINRPV